jgi:membrane protease YdiL (CAAX protease family)
LDENIMTNIQSFIKQHSILTYYILTFSISWGAVLLLIACNGMPTTQKQLDAQLPVAILAMLGGPSVAGLLMVGIVYGKAGFRELLARLLKRRVSIRWYAVAFLTAPLVLIAVSLVLSLTSPAYLPSVIVSDDKMSLILMGIMAGLAAGIFEELGWTGFVVPELRSRFSILTAGLIAGVIWGAWHILSNDVWAIRTISGTFSPIVYLVVNGLGFLIGQLPPYRILMVWVYDRTGSLLVTIFMHATLTASTFILGPLGISGMPLLIYDLGLVVAMWIVVTVVLRANGVSLKQELIKTRKLLPEIQGHF